VARIQRFTSRVDAEVAASMLNARGIDARVVNDDTGGMHPNLAFGHGGSEVIVPDDQLRGGHRAARRGQQRPRSRHITTPRRGRPTADRPPAVAACRRGAAGRPAPSGGVRRRPGLPLVLSGPPAARRAEARRAEARPSAAPVPGRRSSGAVNRTRDSGPDEKQRIVAASRTPSGFRSALAAGEREKQRIVAASRRPAGGGRSRAGGVATHGPAAASAETRGPHLGDEAVVGAGLLQPVEHLRHRVLERQPRRVTA